jgi:thiamine transport system permease protein
MDRNRLALKWSLVVGRRWLLLVPLIFLALFFFYPLLTLFGVSLAPEGQLNPNSFVEIVTSDYYRETLWFTFWQSALSTLLTIMLALPGAYVFSRYQFPGKYRADWPARFVE